MTARYNEYNLQCTEMIDQSREAYLQPCCSKENMSSNLIRVTFFKIMKLLECRRIGIHRSTGERVSINIEKRCKSSLRIPVLNLLFAFNNSDEF
jgi:hypothetical protein